MRWSVIRGDDINRLAYKKNNLDHLGYWDFDCASPEVLACGSTYVSQNGPHDSLNLCILYARLVVAIAFNMNYLFVLDLCVIKISFG